MAKYRLYVDEVGDGGLKHVRDPQHRFLSLTGVIAELGYVRDSIHPELESIKNRYFDSHPDEPVVLHRKELVNAAWPFHALRDSETRAAFDTDMLARFHDWDYRVLTVCLDKQAFVATGLNDTYDPYNYCLTTLVELFGNWLNRCESKGDVMVETRGSNEDKKLKGHFRTLWEDGTRHVAAEVLQESLTSREVKINAKDKNISGLQLADLIAHPLRSAILNEHGFYSRPLTPYVAQLLAILEAKYYQEDGVIIGKCFMP